MANTIKSGILKGAQYKKTANNEIQKIHLETDSDQVLVDNGESSLTTALSNIRSGLSDLSSAVTDLSDTVQSLPDNNTTYSFANGTDGFTVTPSGGTAQTVKVSTNLAGSNLSGTLPVGKGGTGADNATDARTNLGLGAAALKGVTTSVISGSSDLVTSGAVYTAIDNLPEPMVFKGSLGTGGTITSLPTAASNNEGHTYKVIVAGTYASKAAKVGDTFICAKTGSSTYEWVLIPSGDEPSGTVISVNGAGVSESHISVTGGPITSSGTLSVGVESGYAIPSTNQMTAWTNKQDALSAQTAYSAKGTSTKVPQITTNELGQVTGITEVAITFPADTNTWRPVTLNNQTVIGSGTDTGALALGTVSDGALAIGASGHTLTFSCSRAVKINSGTKSHVVNGTLQPEGGNAIENTGSSTTGKTVEATLGNSGVTAGVYSSVGVNSKGIVTVGAYNIKYASSTDADISDLVVGGTLYVVS